METTQNKTIYGLVLAGGQSSRMGEDKAGLIYQSQMQSRVCYQLLAHFCAKVFLSCRAEQATQPTYLGFSQLHDRYHHIGPLGGVLTAMETYPDKTWLVLACDLPGMDQACLAELIAARDSHAEATVFWDAEAQLLEPLCTVYEPAILPRLQRAWQNGQHGLRYILSEARVYKVLPQRPHCLRGVNTPHEREQFLAP